ncbi:MAG: hypothetical protein JXQ83_04505, partial [Candidatus Glassbacteria bacterium]|nr:hypothetical protein [Candidatus Glassbacteria bacterium]
ALLASGPLAAKVIGDFNNDGKLNIADAIMFIRHLMGHEVIPEVGRELTEPGGVFLLYRDILGNVEYEADNEYPPPDELDDYYDGEITVTLRFGEALDIFQKDEVYGYMITLDTNPVNYHFKFVPDGLYWVEAEFVILDSCFYDYSAVFQHDDSLDTVADLQPVFLGTNMDCFDLILTGVSGSDCVQVDERTWVTRRVYERFYRDLGSRGEAAGLPERPAARKRKAGR